MEEQQLRLVGMAKLNSIDCEQHNKQIFENFGISSFDIDFYFGIFILGKLRESLEIFGFLPSFIRLLIFPFYDFLYTIRCIVQMSLSLEFFIGGVFSLSFALLVMIQQFSVQQVLTTFRLVKIWVKFQLGIVCRVLGNDFYIIVYLRFYEAQLHHW